MIGLRVFKEIKDLKIAVEVGLVVGVIPQTTLTGSAILGGKLGTSLRNQLPIPTTPSWLRKYAFLESNL